MKTRSFVVDGRDVVRFFLRLRQIASSIFRNERKIGLFNDAFGKLPRQFPMRLIIFRDHKTAACFFIQAVDNARPFFSADSRKGSAMAEQRIDQGVLAMASAWMNDKPGWFIDHDEIIVLEENLERTLHYIDAAAKAGSRVVLFPEANLTSYYFPYLIDLDSSAVQDSLGACMESAARNRIWVILQDVH